MSSADPAPSTESIRSQQPGSLASAGSAGPTPGAIGTPKWMKALVIVGAVFLVLSGYALVNYPAQPADKPAPRTPLSPDYPGDLIQISPFRLVDQEGEGVTESIFSKRVTITSWVFSNCPLACPTIIAQMINLQRDLADTNVQFVAMGLDPEHDSPSIMKQWGQKVGVDWRTWKFVTEPHPLENGAPALIARQLLVNDFKVHVDEAGDDPITLADGSTMSNIIHPFEIYLVGPKGQLIARYSARRQEEIDALRTRARDAATELKGRLGTGSPGASR